MTLENTDSSSAMQSLLATYAESESEDEDKPSKSAIDAISDEETDTPTPTATQISRPSSRPPSSLAVEDENSRSDVETNKKGTKRKHPNRLVSYGADDLEEDDDDDDDDDQDDDEEKSSTDSVHVVEHGTGYVEGKIMNSSLNIEQASSLSRSMLNKNIDEIELPAEPQGTCPVKLQNKIAELYQRRQREGLNLNNSIQRRVDFRNPSIYEKLIEHCGIDEKGTNYPPELYDPSIWGKESYYDSLDKVQKSDMEKREKERKERTKVEFVVATKKAGGSKTEMTSLNSITIKSDDKKRKSKWDAEPSSAIRIADNINRSIASGANLTVSATGTKSTVISATGIISKKAVK